MKYALAMLLCVAGAHAQADIVRLDSRIDHLLPPGTAVENVADGFNWLEGPVWWRDSLLFSDIPANRVHRLRAGRGTTVFLERSGFAGDAFAGREPGSNGLAIDSQGRLVLCEHGNRRITRLETDGSRTVLVDRYQGKRLNSPNDLVYTKNGDLYFTDPPFGLPRGFDDAAREIDFSGVYRLRADGALELLTDAIYAPNGIALSRDERTLYVSDVDPKRSAWLGYDIGTDGRLRNARVLIDLTSESGSGRGAPDGIEVDAMGNLYGAGPGGVFVMAPDGILLGRIELGVPTANLAWGENGTVLYVTANTAVYRIQTATRGAGYQQGAGSHESTHTSYRRDLSRPTRVRGRTGIRPTGEAGAFVASAHGSRRRSGLGAVR